MVITRETVAGFLRELESQLPINDADIGSRLRELSEIVIPVLNLADYDPDNPSAGGGATNQNFSEFGQLIAIEPGTKELTSVGLQTHTYVLNAGGVPAGEVHVYRELQLFTDSPATEEFTGFMTGFGIGAFSLLKFSFIIPSNPGYINVLSTLPDLTSAPAQQEGMVLSSKPLIMYPGAVLTLQGTTTIADGKKTSLTMLRERYQTNLTPVDTSAEIDASAA